MQWNKAKLRRASCFFVHGKKARSPGPSIYADVIDQPFREMELAPLDLILPSWPEPL